MIQVKCQELRSRNVQRLKETLPQTYNIMKSNEEASFTQNLFSAVGEINLFLHSYTFSAGNTIEVKKVITLNLIFGPSINLCLTIDELRSYSCMFR